MTGLEAECLSVLLLLLVLARSEVIEMKELEWGEWVRMRDTKAVKPEFEKYWCVHADNDAHARCRLDAWQRGP